MSKTTILGLGLSGVLFVSVFAYGQPAKPVVAINSIDTAAQNISCKGWDRANYDCNRDLSEGFRIMLETAITKTGKMDVMERTQLENVLQEQGLSAAGLTTAGGGIGGLTGVDYLIYGTITRFGSQESGISVSSNRGVGSLLGSRGRQAAGGGLDTKNLSVSMGIDLKVTDTSTGRIVIADEVSGTIKAGSSFSVGGISQSNASADPFADVQRVVAARIAEAVVTTRTPVKVIAVQGNGTLVLNYGNVFFSPGDQLAAFEIGEVFTDPDTGEVLGAEETPVGSVEIVSSDARLSRATILEGDPSLFSSGTTLKRIVVDTTSNRGNKRQRSGGSW